MPLYGDDGDYHRRHRPSPHRSRYSRDSDFLDPNFAFHLDAHVNDLHRTRSQGHRPVPNIHIYNQNRNESRSPPYPPSSRSRSTSRSPEHRGRHRNLRDDLGDELLAQAVRDQLVRDHRSRSRGRSDVSSSHSKSDFLEWEMRENERKVRELERRELERREAASKSDELKRLEDRLKTEYEIKRLKEAAKHEEEEAEKERVRKRVLEEAEAKARKEKADAVERRKKFELEIENEKKAAAERRKQYEREIEAEKKEAKERRKRLEEELEREKKAEEEREKKEYEAFKAKEKAKEEKAKEEKKKKEEELDEHLRARLRKLGFREEQLDAMVKEENQKKSGNGAVGIWRPPRAPVYAKIHRDHLLEETLLFYDIPYEVDRIDPHFFIILREMDKYETDVLFEHTKRLRNKDPKLLLEPARKKPEYAWYRKRDRSTSRVRKIGILEFKS